MIDFTGEINPDPVYVLRTYDIGGQEQFEGVFTSLHRAKGCAAKREAKQNHPPPKWRKIRGVRAWDGDYWGIHETFLNLPESELR